MGVCRDPEYHKKYRQRNRETIRAKMVIYYLEHRDELLKSRRERNKERWKNDPEFAAKARAANSLSGKKHRARHRIRKSAYARDRGRTDPAFRLMRNLRSRLYCALRGKGAKSARTRELLGGTIEQVKAHLESRFQPGMSWNNYGEWEIDHIKPCASFDLADPVLQRACFHFTNLQPLWMVDNRIKSAKLS